jgi:hypothetical protein
MVGVQAVRAPVPPPVKKGQRMSNVQTRVGLVPDARSRVRPLRPLARGESRVPGILAGNEKALGELMVRAVSEECGFLLGSTKDGGALSLTLYFATGGRRTYPSSPEALAADIEEFLGLLDRQKALATPARPIARD